MLDLDFSFLLKGIQFLLGIQLILVAVLHFSFKPDQPKKLLAILCLIHGLWFFKHTFVGHWESDLLLFIIIGPGKPIFAGAIILFYFKSLSDSLEKNHLLTYLIPPGVYYITLIILRFFLGNAINIDPLRTSTILSGFVLLIFWFYFFVTRKEILHHLRTALIPRAYHKVLLLFYSLYFFLLQIPVWDIYSKVLEAGVLPPAYEQVISDLYHGFFKYAGYYASYTYIHFLGYFLFLYSLSELPVFKKMFLPKETMINQKVHKQLAELDLRVNHFFHEKKGFTDPNLTLSSCSKFLGLTRKEFMDYLTITGQGLFKDFLNKLRTEEVKKLMLSEDSQKYDLVGLALESGFKSKSTFFRVFKNIEGITPREYQHRILKS